MSKDTIGYICGQYEDFMFEKEELQCCPEAAPSRQSRIFNHDGPLEMHWCANVCPLQN